MATRPAPASLRVALVREAVALGFDEARITTPNAIGSAGDRLIEFLEQGRHGDMAWMATTLVVLSILSAVLVAARRLVVWVAAGALGTGVAGLALGEGTAWSLAVVGVGAVAAGAAVLHQRLGWER